MNLKKLTLFTLSLALSAQALGHSRWMLPSHYNLSSEKGEWVMVDITASNETFNVDKAMGTDLVKIITPNGKATRPASSYKGHRKSVIDYFIKDSGTYKITNNTEPAYMTTYTVNEKRKRVWKNKMELADALPKNAQNINTSFRSARVETYITMNQPSDNFTRDGHLLELIPITHPSDIVENEATTFKLFFNGQVQKNVEVEIVADGVRYRNNPQVLKLTSDKNGEISFTLKEAGRYLLVAEYSEKVNNHDLYDEQAGSVFLTFDAQLN
jgi:uncharacterized GH25 family protein